MWTAQNECSTSMKKRRQFLLGLVAGAALALIIMPPARGFSCYVGVVIVLIAALALTLLLMAKVAGKL
jgi:hypothetical protein